MPEEKKKEIRVNVTEYDELGFKFLNMTLTPEFTHFIAWIQKIRDKINRVDTAIPTMKIDATRREVENAGVKAMVMRAKVGMLDDIMLQISSLQKKQELLKKKETKDG